MLGGVARNEILTTVRGLAAPERVLEVLRVVADTAGPSQTASDTRGVAIHALLEGRGNLGEEALYERNLAGTGCDVLRVGTGAGIRIVAHLDEISYLLAGHEDTDGWPLAPFCYHLAEGPREAAVLRHRPQQGYQIVSTGTLDGPPDRVRYRSLDGDELHPGDRIILRSAIEADLGTGRVTGSLDNAAGVSAALLAAEACQKLGVPVTVVLTDEEEGPAGASSQTIARGAARLAPVLEPTTLTVVVDVHGLPPTVNAEVGDHRVPFGASLAEYSSGGRGAVTPPPLFHQIRELLDHPDSSQLRVTTNLGGHVPRSDDVIATLASPAVCLLGYPGSDRHFDQGLPATNLQDLVDLTRALTMLAAAFAGDPDEEGA